MLQRSPTYIGSLPGVDPFAVRANRLLPDRLAHIANRWKAIAFSTFQYQLARKRPAYMRKLLMTMAERRLPKGYDVEKHFGPRYNVWDQRLCLAPDGDFFRTIRHGKADVVTDTIDRFTKTGIKLTSGEELQADIIVTATGLNMQLLGGVQPTRNGEPFDLTSLMTYKGLMFSGVPNFAITFGYTNASWTLKADLVSEFVCRLLNYMDAKGFDTVEPQHPGRRRRRAAVHGLQPRLLPAFDALASQIGVARAVAAQAELLVRHAHDPARQDRRRGPAVRQKACASCGLALRRRRCRRRRCRRSRRARTSPRRG